jgi:hypothetical protein
MSEESWGWLMVCESGLEHLKCTAAVRDGGCWVSVANKVAGTERPEGVCRCVDGKET